MVPIHKHYSGVRYHTWRKRDPELPHPASSSQYLFIERKHLVPLWNLDVNQLPFPTELDNCDPDGLFWPKFNCVCTVFCLVWGDESATCYKVTPDRSQARAPQTTLPWFQLCSSKWAALASGLRLEGMQWEEVKNRLLYIRNMLVATILFALSDWGSGNGGGGC